MSPSEARAVSREASAALPPRELVTVGFTAGVAPKNPTCGSAGLLPPVAQLMQVASSPLPPQAAVRSPAIPDPRAFNATVLLDVPRRDISVLPPSVPFSRNRLPPR